jgi:branched-subunit amino acid aminotransferase/4-amino-4-deoxychorismate lyase
LTDNSGSLSSPCYFCGEWVDAARARFTLDDRGCTQGVIAVERLRTHGGRLRFVADYVERLSRTTEWLGLIHAEPAEGYIAILNELVNRCKIIPGPRTDVAIVLLVSPGPVGGPATVIAHAEPLHWERIERWIEFGQRLRVPSIPQIQATVWPRHLKVRNRLHYYLADREVQAIDPEASALLADANGDLTETSVANIATIIGENFFVPPAEHVLPGVTLKQVFRLAREQGLTVQERPITREVIWSSDEALLTGSTAGIWGLTHLDDQPIGTGKTGQLTRTLQRAWNHLTSA